MTTGLSLILVRNTVTHDARVLREAATLQGLGVDVLVAGVVSTNERELAVELDGIRVVRLAPADGLRGVLRRGSQWHAEAKPVRPGSELPVAAGDDSSSGADPRNAARRLVLRMRRLAVTIVYYVQGVSLVRRTSPVLVHANDYNTMWIGIAAKMLRRSRLVYDSHELWPDRNGRPEWRPWLLACEAIFVRAADAVITTSPGYARAMARRYRVSPPAVVRNIPNPGHGPTLGVGRRPPFSRDPLAVYIGGLMPGRGLEQAIRALALAGELRLRLIGPGSDAYRAALLECAEEVGVAERVEIESPVAPAAVVDAVADASFGLMLIEPVCRSYELTLPNKLFEYAAAGLPILASDLQVIGPLVSEEQLGAVVPPDDVGQIAEAMRRLAEPRANAQIREHVRAFAQRVTWESERHVLELVYSS